MPVAGAKPKPQGQAIHRNKLAHEWTEVPDVAFKGGPSLPTRTPSGDPWPLWCKKWWKVISTMPHCVLWSDSDWQFAMDTAIVKLVFYTNGSTNAAVEARNREKVLGTTVDSRRDLRIRYVKVEEQAVGEGVTKLDDYRDL